ncbi:cytochrome-c oxidase, cbb3-type subunit III [Propionivibrio sp.]|uniref:cytochrome-c oxidase, cbb3-type subunit III n=1 Tax=Propionivibrio sp. TaxID=2212460 RepID=UPI0025EDA6DD|nr:cytochrome-c oxidase, cbb3-type subunit III [Propionivibrio sp.]MBK7355750.1 cytochrome-c oxidase, cbb3-type subunit III [Propionivibrio sp.]MBK8400586.1 cytochrome-c oxidase, cbb3-type subunit III [Propionivibrio sp.]MBK8744341.1 cytochrome-c oxidase, cbb3-type subunit III [Propionivibrio sp.]MBK8895149.1 cytochrome-c oxidase, cbb3-type subunit III [Propionivibrio sp.]MBL0206945.1 cytochrome-c oxidase, cbb3-type subunit III [Propionivibrio sp.]
MSDFVNEFWNWYVILGVLASILACGIILWIQSIHHPVHEKTTDTTGHVWDETLEEFNNPLPKWWMWLFYATIVFALIYAVLYPTLGRFQGVLGWSTASEHALEVKTVEDQVKPLFDKYLKMDLKAVAADEKAMEMGGRLYQTYCMQCHGATAQGSKEQGFPNLTDKDWLWGGEPEQIVETIANGRAGMMPPYGGNPDAIGGEAGAKEVANYVRSLSGLSHDNGLAAKGKTKFESVCVACHGQDGKGTQAMGAPNLTDKVWLYGSSESKIVETITKGRTNQMPAWKGFLGEAKVHLLAAYVLNLSAAVDKK